ncbi:DUF2249 domain-containing protein [Cerasibacillus terrae]|uniref:DUF2249 domain-containing protein n=1 Tax=Cerasibacillus terrae TaxID=2498845 RepID=A0A5C8NWX4_9BACI|nr:DUF2249 domain-containing protein [Cerasibacillus terrae]TXL65747.1 DUF2249 domain-containing protein [Cerasibacillus terrae]
MENVEYAVKIHAPNIEPRFRHQHIFDEFDGMTSGQFMELSNDHDPKPLHYQFMMERKDQFSWEYLEDGPTLWRIAIGKK